MFLWITQVLTLVLSADQLRVPVQSASHMMASPLHTEIAEKLLRSVSAWHKFDQIWVSVDEGSIDVAFGESFILHHIQQEWYIGL